MDITLINNDEISLAKQCVELALNKGVSEIRVSLSKCTLDSISLRDGSIDKVIHAADRSIFIHLFINNKYGTYSTNRLDINSLDDFLDKAIDNTLMLAEDKARKLPNPSRCAKDAMSGNELGLIDKDYFSIDSDMRLDSAFEGIKSFKPEKTPVYSIISVESEYTDSLDDNYLIDSNGVECRHTETSYSYSTDITIKDKKGNYLTGFSCAISPFKKSLKSKTTCSIALDKAISQINHKKHRGGKFNMVVSNLVAVRLVSPIIASLNGEAIHQKRSFLASYKGKRVFPEELTITDNARKVKSPGSRYFDTEGVATKNRKIINAGRLTKFFISTYSSSKLGLAPTVEGISNPTIKPFLKGLESKGKDLSLQSLLSQCGDGIYVTGFNGGNCNSVTGNFSYGVEGFIIKDGKIGHPIKEMIITGNMIELWNNLMGVANDARKDARWKIPTLAFSNIDFSA